MAISIILLPFRIIGSIFMGAFKLLLAGALITGLSLGLFYWWTS